MVEWRKRTRPVFRWTERLRREMPNGAAGVVGRRVYPSIRRAKGGPSAHQRKETTMSPLRERMIEDMILAGLALGTRQAYTQAVRRLAARSRRKPQNGRMQVQLLCPGV